MLGITLKKTQVYQDIKEEVQEEAREEARKEVAGMVLSSLTKRLRSPVPEAFQSTVQALPLLSLKALNTSLLDFSTVDDVRTWLEANQSN